ncbi:MAG TPA: ABC transporter permease [Acidimicrobiia bacterium]|nr:ABC transporter permease [Acidimicrobiia bacterium]
MSTPATDIARRTDRPGAAHRVPVRVAVADPGWRGDLRTAGMIWQREILRFLRAKVRIATGFAQPLLFLVVLGAGLGPLVGESGGVGFRQFVFPGVVAMGIVTTAMFSAVSIVWDREFGFLREMLVAPVSRSALVLGKAAGGATVATAQGGVMLVLAPVVGLRLTPSLVAGVLGAGLLMAFAMTTFGVFVATRIRKMESFQVVMQFLMLPMLFLSGALFPLGELPAWLTALTRLNPLTYAVDPLRRAAFAGQDLPASALERFPTGVDAGGYTLPLWGDLAVVVAFAGVFFVLAARTFGRPD